MNPVKAIKSQLYLLQLENYDLLRFFRLMWTTRGGFRLPKPRKRITWTPKLSVVFFISGLLAAGSAVFPALALGAYKFWFLLFFLWLWLWIYFLFIVLAVVLLWPADFLLKQIIIGRAKRKIQKFPELTIIGITGSYGKTTMKEILATVLKQKFLVLKTPENINTPLGLARLILDKLQPDIQVLVVEMGAYKRGDIQALCELARPRIAILTGINEAHLERFRSLENTIAAKFEILENSAADGLVFLNQDDERVTANYQKFASGKKIKFYSSRDGRERQLPLLGDYARGIVSAAVMVAQELGLSDEQINGGVAEIQPIPHRLQLIQNRNGITIIDDSYNANPDGAREAIKVLGRFAGRRKIYVTPGLVEMGERSVAIHREIGKLLAQSADLVVLIKNSATPSIAEGLRAAGYPADRIKWYDEAQSAYAAVPHILKAGDVVLFQNDWPDNYR